MHHDSETVVALLENKYRGLKIIASGPIQSLPISVRAVSHAIPAQIAVLRAIRIFDLVELVVPKQLADEVIGDALEVIYTRVRNGCPAWQVYLKMMTTLFWIAIHAVHEAIRGSSKKKGS